MKNFKRLWFAGLAGMGFGFIVQLVASLFGAGQIGGWLMLVLIAAGAVGSYFVLTNNNDFGLGK